MLLLLLLLLLLMMMMMMTTVNVDVREAHGVNDVSVFNRVH